MQFFDFILNTNCLASFATRLDYIIDACEAVLLIIQKWHNADNQWIKSRM